MPTNNTLPYSLSFIKPGARVWEHRCKSVRTLNRCMICSSLLHDTHTAVLINTAVLILHCRTIYQKKKPTGAIIPMSFSSCFPHAAYHLHATSHPHFTIFVFSTHKNSKNIKTGWKDNKVKLPASAAFFVLLWAKIGSVEWEENWEIGDIRLHFHHMFWSYKDNQCSGRGIYRIKIWDYSHSESGRSAKAVCSEVFSHCFVLLFEFTDWVVGFLPPSPTSAVACFYYCSAVVWCVFSSYLIL